MANQALNLTARTSAALSWQLRQVSLTFHSICATIKQYNAVITKKERNTSFYWFNPIKNVGKYAENRHDTPT
jgi:hypothetical protein